MIRHRTYRCEQTLTAAGTAEVLGSGSNTFPTVAPDYIEIGYASKACYIGPTETSLASDAAGDYDERIYIAEGTIGRIIRWDGETKDVWFENAVGGEQPFLAVIGWVGE